VKTAILGGGIMTTWWRMWAGHPCGSGLCHGRCGYEPAARGTKPVPEANHQPGDCSRHHLRPGSTGKSIALNSELQKSGLNSSLFPEQAKLEKQLKFADRSGFRFVLILGPEEDAKRLVMLKDLKNRTQEAVDRKELAVRIQRLLEMK